MATPVIMPRQGQSVETCVITKWLLKKGDKVKTGDLLFSYETDKAAFDMESPVDGTLLDIFFEDGEEVPVLVNVAAIGNAGESADPFRPSRLQDKTEQPSDVTDTARTSEERPAGADKLPSQNAKIRISPRARAVAQSKGIEIADLIGSGPGGRIITSDVEKMAEGGRQPIAGRKSESGHPATKNDFTDQPLSNVRKIISKAMHTSLQNSAQLTHHLSADARKLLDYRKKIKEETASGKTIPDITMNDMICWCVIKALLKFPEMNSHFLDDKIRTFTNVHLGLAVDTRRGLMVPAVRNCDSMDLVTLSKELRMVTDSCRKGNIDPELLKSTSSSFTVSNLGSYGVEMFTPVINLPQAGILGVCSIIHRPADLGNGVFGFIPVMGLSLTYDHRAVDGGPATLFLKEIKNNIENFTAPNPLKGAL